MKYFPIFLLILIISFSGCDRKTAFPAKKIDDTARAEQIKEMEWGMFVCWSFSTFYGQEWTPTLDKDAAYFKATGCDTDQWCKAAKDAGMGYILFLSKHHDGFCLWDTKTTDKKVTNSPLEMDVLAKLRKSCDKYGIKLALYFSEGDWNWPGAVDGKGHRDGSGINPEMKKAQLKELLTNYGPIEFWWMDHAVGDGGLSHQETVEWVHQFQPNSFVGFNHGEPAGRLSLREMGKPGIIGDASTTKYNKDAEANYKGYLAAEFTYPILPPHEGGAMWFYSLPKHDTLCHPAEKLYQDYLGAVKYGNIFSIDIGPNYEGRLRDIDVHTLTRVGEMIKAPVNKIIRKGAVNKIIRKGAVIKVKPDKLEFYKELHANPWEGVNNKLKECNIQNYSIYYRDGYLFSYLEYTGDNWEEDMKKIAADSTTQAWWKLTDPCQEPVPFANEGEWWAELEEVYHLD